MIKGSFIKPIPTFKKSAKIAAIKKFVTGPDNETIAMSFLPSLRLNGSTGTGLAAPRTIGEPERIRIKGKSMLIKGSMWGIGLRVILPSNLAVGSPSLSATHPCATSCKIAENTRIIIVINVISRFIVLF